MCSLGRDILNGNCAFQMREIWALWSRRGVLYLKPYLTAWINSPLFRCWAGAHPLLGLSFNNHAGFLSSLQCTVSYTGITNPGSTVWVGAQSAIILLGTLVRVKACSLDMSVKRCQAQLYKVPFQSSPSSPSHILKCSPDWITLHPPGPLVYQKSIFKTEIHGVQAGLCFGNFPYTEAKNVKRSF